MPFVKADMDKEYEHLQELINTYPEAKRACDLYNERMALQAKLINARKEANISQSELARRTGMTQQQVSRVECGTNWNITSLLKYLSGIGWELQLGKTAK